MASSLDATDRSILGALVSDGRMSIRSLAQSLHISRANAYARLERLLSSGVIRGFRAEVDPTAVGMGTSAYITINLQQGEWREVRSRLLEVAGVAHIALVGGEFDVIVLVRARDNADLRRVVLDEIHSIPGVLSTRTLLVFEESDPAVPGAVTHYHAAALPATPPDRGADSRERGGTGQPRTKSAVTRRVTE